MVKSFNITFMMITLAGCFAISEGMPSLGKTSSAGSMHHGVQKAASASSVTGSYELDYHGKYCGSLEVQTLSGGRIKFQLIALGALSDPGGPSIGEADGVVVLHQPTTTYRLGDSRIVMRFKENGVVVSQHGDMGFGLDTDASGTYFKRSKKPNFDSSINQQ